MSGAREIELRFSNSFLAYRGGSYKRSWVVKGRERRTPPARTLLALGSDSVPRAAAGPIGWLMGALGPGYGPQATG